MHKDKEEKNIHSEESLQSSSQFELVMAENIKLKAIIKQLKRYIEGL